MWWINRVYLDGVGHQESFYKDITLNLKPADNGQGNTINHTYIQLVNGGGKTTLISFFLTLFDPRKKRFVQVVAGKKRDYHYSDYFHPELSLLMAELINAKGERLLLGQYHQKVQDEVDPVFFLCDLSNDLYGYPFDLVPSRSRAEADESMRPYVGNLKQARHWLQEQVHNRDSGIHWRMPATQTEWFQALREYSVNIEIIRTLVTLNSEEGGIRKFAEYSTERSFLMAFFGCVLAPDQVESLREALRKEISRGRELNAYRRQEVFFEELVSQWERLEQPVSRMAQLSRERREIVDTFAQRLRDLAAHRKGLIERQSTSTQSLHELDSQYTQTNQRRSEIKGQITELAYRQLELDRARCHAKHEQLKRAVTDAEQMIEALEVARIHRDWALARHEAGQHQAAIRAFQNEHEKPLQAALDRVLAQSLRVHNDRINTLEAQLREHEQTLGRLNTTRASQKRQVDERRQRKGKLEQQLETCNQTETRARNRMVQLRDQGVIEHGETPERAHLRLTDALNHARAQSANARQVEQQARRAVDAAVEQYRAIDGDLERAKARLTAAQDTRDAGVRAYNALSEAWRVLNPQRPAPDWQQTSLRQRLSDEIDGRQRDLDEIQLELIGVRQRLSVLKATGHQLLDEQVNDALEALYAQGISREKLWSFPKYLASLCDDDPQRIAAYVDRDPGRYMGIVAIDDDTLAALDAHLDRLNWQGRPIPIYRLRANELDAPPEQPPARIIAPVEKLLYSEKACADEIQRLEQTVRDLEARRSALKKARNDWNDLKNRWEQYYEQYGVRWQELEATIAAERQACADLEARLKQAETALASCRETLATRETQRAEREAEEKALDQAQRTLSPFLEGLWQEWQSAQQKIPGLRSKIQSVSREIEELEVSQQQLEEQISSLQAQKVEQASERDRHAQRMGSALYSGAAPWDGEPVQLSPDDAHARVSEAQFKLNEAQNSVDIQQLKQAQRKAEKEMEMQWQALQATPAWLRDQAAVKKHAASSPDIIAQQIRGGHETLKKRIERRDELANEYRQLDDKAEDARLKRPSPVPALPDEWIDSSETMAAAQQRLSAQSIELKQAADKLEAEREHLSKTLRGIGEGLIRLDAITSRIEAVHAIPASGQPEVIADLRALDTDISALKREYDTTHKALEQHTDEARQRFSRLENRISVEQAKPEDEQAEPVFLRRWTGHTLESVVANYEDISRSLKDCLAASKNQIERIHQLMDMTTKDLEMHLHKAIELLRKATRVRIPESSSVLPGQRVITMSGELSNQSIDFRNCARQCLERWLRQGEIPNEPGERDALTADMVQTLFPEGALKIKLIKTLAFHERAPYTLITALKGSNGQVLTTAFLLFVTVIKVRESDTGMGGEGFLLADNPIGECNADSLLRIQMAMADAYRIQLIYLSGHTDPNAKSMFQNHLLMNREYTLRQRHMVTPLNPDQRPLWVARLQARLTQNQGRETAHEEAEALT